MLLKVMLAYSPVAVMSLLLTCTVISVDDGLLRTSTGCTGPSSSLTLYVAWLKLIIESLTREIVVNCNVEATVVYNAHTLG